jgi:23S rRNA pseudouridine1911/1915/1917 synthase
MQANGTDLTRLVVDQRWDGERLDLYLAGVTELSRRAARRSVANGEVWRNGNPLRVQSRTVELGDVIDVLRPRRELGVPCEAEIERPEILYEDRWLLVAAKPAGVLSQPAEENRAHDVSFDQIVLRALALREGRRPFLRLLHRLDRVTSGAILFARDPRALPHLTRAWSSGQVERVYLAVVEGKPATEAFEIDKPITRDRNHTWRFQADPSGKSARTEVRVLAESDNGLAVVRCRLITGRTHQVRVHLASVGHPVLGDRLYGSIRAAEAIRPLLHAVSLVLPHPDSGETLRVTCPPPTDFLGHVPHGLDLLAE